MKASIVFLSSAVMICGGCTTVNLQTMAGGDEGTVVTDYESESNVVQRAVQRLRDAFASRGFGADTSERKMEAAADMLLNGLSDRGADSGPLDYAQTVSDLNQIRDDVKMARSHVEQTSRAAEIYLEVAPARRDLSDELTHLEAALLASEKARQVFTVALADEGQTDLILLSESLDRLRRVTDAFGDRVRLSNSDKLAIDAASRVG